MQERSCVFPAWKVLAVAVACALLLLSSAGLLYVLLRQTELTQELLRLDAQMQALSRSCRLQVGTLTVDPAAEDGEVKNLRRRRRNQEGAATSSQDEKDVLMLLTYSRVPVRHVWALFFFKEGVVTSGGFFFFTIQSQKVCLKTSEGVNVS